MKIPARACHALVLSIISGFIAASSAQAQKHTTSNIKPKQPCSALTGTNIPANQIGLPTRGAAIISATVKPGTGPDATRADFVPEFCDIEGAIAPIDSAAPKINFRVNIPTVWNRKAFQIGGNGMDGFIPNLSAMVRNRPGPPLGPAYPPDRQFPLAQGYATYGSDSGHGGAVPPDQAGRAGTATPAGPPQGDLSWMGNDESLVNFAYQQIKKTHDVSMQIMVRMYGTKAKVNYFAGESQGGREALMAMTHYPEDYDGVLSSVGLIYFTGIILSPVERTKVQLTPGAWVPPTKAPAIRAEVLRLCDSLDGLEDGVINNYYACNRMLDPTITPSPLAHLLCPAGADADDNCLSDAQIATINSFHTPFQFGFPLSNGESDWPGEPSGSEAPVGWLLNPLQPVLNGPSPGPGAGILKAVLRDPTIDPLALKLDTVKTSIQHLSGLIDVRADWSKFFARGGKLIMHSAANDYVSNPRGQMRMYEEVVKRSGQGPVDKYVRYYVTPNANHGSVGTSAKGTPLPRYMDLLTPLQEWVEKGVAPPEAIRQTLEDPTPPYVVQRSRPLCRYPKYPRYNGSGNPDSAESYSCTAP